MIKRIEIKNFQAHKNTEIDFDPGVNVISGASDAGKSSIFRALLWVITNRPSGDSIKNWDCKKDDTTEVRIGLSDLIRIS
jgi:DNA repair exonuclease SbcCD ATPase subunit